MFWKTKKASVEKGTGDLAKKLYQQNIEVAERNKILSFLRRLYQLVIQTTEPDKVAESITKEIRDELEFELVGILIHKPASDELTPFKFATSDRFQKAREHKISAPLWSITIQRASQNEAFKAPLIDRRMTIAVGLSSVWGDAVRQEALSAIEAESNIHSVLLYPLITADKVIGVLLICINRHYDELTNFEKESIGSFISVTSVALDRAFIYRDLENANIKLRELDDLKSQFLSFASHQVKAPMAVVKGFAELIAEGAYGAVNDKIKETAGKIIMSANKLIDLVTNILDMRKIEEGKMNYDFQKIDLISLAKEAINELKPLADSKKLDLAIDSKIPGADSIGSPQVRIKADSQKFKQVILNFVDNAIKYTPAGFVKIQILNDGRRPGNVMVAVSDSGLGISKELMPKLFRQFSRDKEVGKQILGTGLGLFIAKQIVKDHGGELWAESDGEGKGSQFYVSVPMVK